jgi:hypothetical protein
MEQRSPNVWDGIPRNQVLDAANRLITPHPVQGFPKGTFGLLKIRDMDVLASPGWFQRTVTAANSVAGA